MRSKICSIPIPWSMMSMLVMFLMFITMFSYLGFVPAVSDLNVEIKCVNHTKHHARPISDSTCVYGDLKQGFFQCEIVGYKQTDFVSINQHFGLVCHHEDKFHTLKKMEILGVLFGLIAGFDIPDLLPRFFGAIIGGVIFVIASAISMKVTNFNVFMVVHGIATAASTVFGISAFVSFSETFPTVERSMVSTMIVMAAVISGTVLDHVKELASSWSEIGYAIILAFVPLFWYIAAMMYPFNLWMTGEHDKAVVRRDSVRSYREWIKSKYMMLFTFSLVYAWCILFFCVADSKNFSTIMHSKGVLKMEESQLLTIGILKIFGIVFTALMFYSRRQEFITGIVVLMASIGFIELYYNIQHETFKVMTMFQFDDIFLGMAIVHLIPMTIEMFPGEIRSGGLCLCIMSGMAGYGMNELFYMIDSKHSYIFAAKASLLFLCAPILGISLMERKHNQMFDTVDQQVEIYENQELIMVIEDDSEFDYCCLDGVRAIDPESC